MGEFRNISLVCIVSFPLYKAYPNGGIWKNKNWQQIYKQAISTFYTSNDVYLQNKVFRRSY